MDTMLAVAARRSSERHDTFIVRSPHPKSPSEEGTIDVATIILPGGKTVHALDRAVFDRAVKRAFEK
jgi:hypothetical protein